MRFSLGFIVLAIIMGCNGLHQRKNPPQREYTKEELQEYNRMVTQKEAQQVQQFVAQKGWPAKESGTGLHYWIYEEGSGPQAKPGQHATVNLTILLLNGDTAYSHVRYGSERFLIDRTNKESGLNEGVQYMQVGDKAKLVMPSYLAHGLMGDMNKVPPRTSLVMDVELLGLD